MASPGSIIALVVAILINALAAAWYVMSSSSLRTCQTTQSPLCPSFFCPTEDATCKNRPFRVVEGEKVCMDSIMDGAPKL